MKHVSPLAVKVSLAVPGIRIMPNDEDKKGARLFGRLNKSTAPPKNGNWF
jgi:hypothetical protein